MKKQYLLFVVGLLLSGVSFPQSPYSYEIFGINTEISYDKIYDYYSETIETITDKSGYSTGDEIEIVQISSSLLGNRISFSFFENTQILHCIHIAFRDDYRVENGKNAWNDAKSQLGTPTRGYEIRETEIYTSSSSISTTVRFKGKFEYCYNGYTISISSSYPVSVSQKSLFKAEFNVCFHKSNCSSWEYPHSQKVNENAQINVEYVKKY